MNILRIFTPAKRFLDWVVEMEVEHVRQDSKKETTVGVNPKCSVHGHCYCQKSYGNGSCYCCQCGRMKDDE